MVEVTVNVVKIGGIETEVIDISRDKTKARVRAGPYIISLKRRDNGWIGKVEGERSYFLSIPAYISWPIPRSCFIAAQKKAQTVLPSFGRHPKVKREKEPLQLTLFN